MLHSQNLRHIYAAHVSVAIQLKRIDVHQLRGSMRCPVHHTGHTMTYMRQSAISSIEYARHCSMLPFAPGARKQHN
jgi:hypothetical protein